MLVMLVANFWHLWNVKGIMIIPPVKFCPENSAKCRNRPNDMQNLTSAHLPCEYMSQMCMYIPPILYKCDV